MKKKVLGLMLLVGIFLVTGCDSEKNNERVIDETNSPQVGEEETTFAEEETSTTSTVFLPEAYDEGIRAAKGDDKYFKPESEDYALLNLKRQDGAPLETTLLVTFNEVGFVTRAVKRIGIVTGQQSGPNGVEPVYADESEMPMHFESYKNEPGVAEASYDGPHIYLNMNQDYILQLNGQILKSEEPIDAFKTLLKTPNALVLDYDLVCESVFMSKPVSETIVPSMPSFCALEDFALFPYVMTNAPSDDFVVTEFVNGDAITTEIVYFDDNGDALLSETLYLNPDFGFMSNNMIQNPNRENLYSVSQPSARSKYDMMALTWRRDYYLYKNYQTYQEAIDLGDSAVYYSKPKTE